MKTIEVCYKGTPLLALVDDADFERVAQKRWWAMTIPRRRTFYVQGYIGGKRRCSLHHFVLGVPVGCQIDHRDGNGLNNSRSNLRLADGTGNRANSALCRNATSGFKGVHKSKGTRWRARIMYHYKRQNLGCFATRQEAARAYDAKAIELFGEFARTNAMLGLLDDAKRGETWGTAKPI